MNGGKGSGTDSAIAHCLRGSPLRIDNASAQQDGSVVDSGGAEMDTNGGAREGEGSLNIWRVTELECLVPPVQGNVKGVTSASKKQTKNKRKKKEKKEGDAKKSPKLLLGLTCAIVRSDAGLSPGSLGAGRRIRSVHNRAQAACRSRNLLQPIWYLDRFCFHKCKESW